MNGKDLPAIVDITQSSLMYPSDSKEIDNWQSMMFSCRKASNILGEEFKEPEFLDWTAGRDYFDALWAAVKKKKRSKKRKKR